LAPRTACGDDAAGSTTGATPRSRRRISRQSASPANIGQTLGRRQRHCRAVPTPGRLREAERGENGFGSGESRQARVPVQCFGRPPGPTGQHRQPFRSVHGRKGSREQQATLESGGSPRAGFSTHGCVSLESSPSHGGIRHLHWPPTTCSTLVPRCQVEGSTRGEVSHHATCLK